MSVLELVKRMELAMARQCHIPFRTVDQEMSLSYMPMQQRHGTYLIGVPNLGRRKCVRYVEVAVDESDGVPGGSERGDSD